LKPISAWRGQETCNSVIEVSSSRKASPPLQRHNIPKSQEIILEFSSSSPGPGYLRKNDTWLTNQREGGPWGTCKGKWGGS
jgi:hypothetical protein